MKKLLLILPLFYAGAISAHAQYAAPKPKPTTEKSDVQFPEANAFKNSAISYKLIPAANNTWCYDIYVEKRLMIHQASVPGLPGNTGFKTKKAAQDIAGLVITKIKKGEMPPSITLEEMKKLKAL